MFHFYRVLLLRESEREREPQRGRSSSSVGLVAVDLVPTLPHQLQLRAFCAGHEPLFMLVRPLWRISRAL